MSPTLDTIAIDAVPSTTPLKVASDSSDITYATVTVSELASTFGDYTDLAVRTRGGKVLTVSEEWFAEADNLITAAAPISRKGHFTAKGAWFDGWETRRHGPSFDWCVIQLGFAGSIAGFEVDTAFFTGNHSPFVSVEGFAAPGHASASDVDGAQGSQNTGAGVPDSAEGWEKVDWAPVLPKVTLNPDSRHGFKIQSSPVMDTVFTHVRFRMYPDGGVSRLRVYGKVHQDLPQDKHQVFDLAAVAAGGQVEGYSDAHFGHPSNLLLPGRGHDMSDGWETKRSRAPGHVDWCNIKLGAAGHPTLIEVDTAHYMGNPPKAVTLHGFRPEDVDRQHPIVLLDEAPVKPHRQHFFEIPTEISSGPAISSVKVVMIPDGGIKRVRIFGSQQWPAAPLPQSSTIGQAQPLPDEHTWNLLTIQAEPITKEAFAPWGQLVEVPVYDPNAISVNQGTAKKFSHLGQFVNLRSYALTPNSNSASPDRANPDIAAAQANLAIFQCFKPVEGHEVGVKLLERHQYSSQMFVPMGGDGNGGYIVVVAKDRPVEGTPPDLSTLKAFTVKNSQGINYKPNVWHHPMLITGKPVTFLTITHESGVGKEDCNEYWFNKEAGIQDGVAAVVRF
ncbi:Allantoicase [Podila verticillata]|nr:Allantoicase [Podila verticillata]